MDMSMFRGRLRVSRRVARASIAIVTLSCILGLGWLTMWTSGRSLRAAEHERIAQRSRLIASLVQSHSYIYDPARVEEVVAETPFMRGATAIDSLLLRQFAVTAEGDSNAVVALVGVDGRVQTAIPSNAPLPLASVHPALEQAAHGHGAHTPTFRYAGAISRAVAVPVGGSKPWAVLVEVTPTRGTLGQSFDDHLGALGPGTGGLSELDGNGIAMTSWNPALIGRRLIDPSRLAQLRSGGVRVWTEPSAQGPVLSIAAAPANMGDIDVFQQPTSSLFGDLRQQQHRRFLTVMSLLGASLGALIIFFLWRQRVARRGEAQLNALLTHGGDLVLVASQDHVLRVVSPVLTTLLGHDADAWRGRALEDLVAPEDVGRLDDLFADAKSTTAVLLNVRLRTADGGTRWFDIRATDLNHDRSVGGVVLTCHATDDRKALEDELRFRARHDALTGLPNRVVFTERLEAAWKGWAEAGTQFAVLFLDVDRFKPINDALGHDAGDHALRTVARRLVAAVGDNDRVTRFGGDEFAVLLDGADEATSRAVAQRVLEALRAPIAWDATLVPLDASIGIALSSSSYAQPEELVRAADAAMYTAKQHGGGRYVVATAAVAPHGVSAVLPRVPASPSAQPRAGGSMAPPPTASIALSREVGGPARAPRRRARARVREALPLVVAGALVIALTTFGIAQQRAARDTAALNRLAERKALTTRIAAWSRGFDDPQRLEDLAAQAPWSLTDAGIDRLILQSFAASPAGGTDTVVALATLQGKTIAAVPDSARAPFHPGDPVWTAALQHGGMLIPASNTDGKLRRCFLIPIMQAGKPVAMLSIAPHVVDSLAQRLTHVVGSLGFGEGGMLGMDSTGRVTVAWDPTLLGKQLVDPHALAGLRTGSAAEVPSSPGQVMLVSRETTADVPVAEYMAFQQPANAFYGDLGRGEQLPDLLQIAGIALAIIVLAMANQRRLQAVHRSRAVLDALLQNAHDIMIVVDNHDRATFVSAAIEPLLGTPARQFGEDVLDQIVDPADSERVRQAVGAARDGSRTTLRDVRLVGAEEGRRWFDVSVVGLVAPGQAGHVVVTCHETSEHKELQDQLAFEGQHDPLTGVANRATFTQRLDSLAEARDVNFAVLFIDLDHFKLINDTYGHDLGDEVLRAVARRLRDSIRAGDSLYRLGGDEFAVLVVDVDEQRAIEVAERILRHIDEPIEVAGLDIRIAATIGLARSHPSIAHPETVVRQADVAMYQAKQAGRGRYAIAEDD
jgi:diguanylate cyclase (GGDEF)-like protein/PAS domain S-box-containing protein